MRDSDFASNNSDADDEESSDGTHFEWNADVTPGRRNPAVRALSFDTDSDEDDDDGSQHQQMWFAEVHNESLSPDNQPTVEPSDNEEESPVSPNLINVEEMAMKLAMKWPI